MRLPGSCNAGDAGWHEEVALTLEDGMLMSSSVKTVPESLFIELELLRDPDSALFGLIGTLIKGPSW